MLQVGSYKFTVVNIQDATAAITNKEMTVAVYPAVSLADTASFAVSMANQAVGAVATVTMKLNDLNGDPIIVPSNATYLNVYGGFVQLMPRYSCGRPCREQSFLWLKW